MANAAPTLLCPACQTPLPALVPGHASLRCPACAIEVDAARMETLVGKPRFVAERSWTGTVLGELVVEDVIGAGGMGTVYRARALADGTRWAVKFLSPSLAAEPELVARFWREVALLEQLDHPAIVKVRAHGERDGLPWFAMELVEGPTLAQRLAKGPLAATEAADIFGRLFAALAHAHDHGIVHRDLKPANVLLAADGARLADFGIARLDLEAATRKTQLTRTDAIIGTFPYMSPEQRAGRPVDARSDLYSAGVMLYEALAGERPEGAFPPLARRRPEVPSRLDPMVRRLLQPEPGARFPSATAAAEALRVAVVGRGRVRRPVILATAGALAVVVALALAGRGDPVAPVTPTVGKKDVDRPSPLPVPKPAPVAPTPAPQAAASAARVEDAVPAQVGPKVAPAKAKAPGSAGKQRKGSARTRPDDEVFLDTKNVASFDDGKPLRKLKPSGKAAPKADYFGEPGKN